MVKKMMIKLREPQVIDCLEMKNQDNAHQHLMSSNFRKKSTTRLQIRAALSRAKLQK